MDYKEYNEHKYEEDYWQIERSKDKWFSKYVKAKIIGNWINQQKTRGSLLDAGGGVGNWAWFFKGKFKKTTVLDVSQKALSKIPEKDIIKVEGSLLKIPLNDKSIDCIIVLDVFEHIEPKDLPKMLSELKRVIKDDGQILIFTSNYGYGFNMLKKRIMWDKTRLTKMDNDQGHLNRLSFEEHKKLLEKMGLKIRDYYFYSIFFQELTDSIKDNLAKFLSGIFGRKKEIRPGQSVKEEIRKSGKGLFKIPLKLLSFISYLDVLLFGKLIPGDSIFLRIVKK